MNNHARLRFVAVAKSLISIEDWTINMAAVQSFYKRKKQLLSGFRKTVLIYQSYSNFDTCVVSI